MRRKCSPLFQLPHRNNNLPRIHLQLHNLDRPPHLFKVVFLMILASNNSNSNSRHHNNSNNFRTIHLHPLVCTLTFPHLTPFSLNTLTATKYPNDNDDVARLFTPGFPLRMKKSSNPDDQAEFVTNPVVMDLMSGLSK